MSSFCRYQAIIGSKACTSPTLSSNLKIANVFSEILLSRAALNLGYEMHISGGCNPGRPVLSKYNSSDIQSILIAAKKEVQTCLGI